MPIARRSGNGQTGPHLVRGVITVVQEGRFTLLCDDGSYRLLLLSPGCPADAPELEQAMRRGMRVMVECRDAPDAIAGEARRIYRADEPTEAPA